MHHLTRTLRRLALVGASALALASCNRAEYATLPRSASYLGSTTVAATPRPATLVAPSVAAAPASAPMAVAPVPAPAPEVAAPLAPVATAPMVAAASAPAATPAPAKLNLVQRVALAKITKKINKLAAKAPQLKQQDATAHTARIGGNLRSAILFGVIGLLLTLLGGIAGIFYVIGVIFIIIGLVFLLLWLLDQA